MAGLSEVPVILFESSEEQAAQIALVENIQREDLNPLEEATAYRALAEQFHLSQEEIARQVGKSRSAVANTMRLLEVPEELHPALISGELTAGHARALLGLFSEEDMLALGKIIIERGLSVRLVEEEVRKWNRRRTQMEAAAEEEEKAPPVVDYCRELEGRIMASIGRRVRLENKQGKTCISFYYEDNEDLEDFLRPILGDDFFDEV